jgi:hypothetical protein
MSGRIEWPDREEMDAAREDAYDGFLPTDAGVASCRICGAWYAIVEEETLPAYIMSGYSSIEWTDATWNPTRGCLFTGSTAEPAHGDR